MNAPPKKRALGNPPLFENSRSISQSQQNPNNSTSSACRLCPSAFTFKIQWIPQDELPLPLFSLSLSSPLKFSGFSKTRAKLQKSSFFILRPIRFQQQRVCVVGWMETLQGDLAELVCEFLEVCIHQLLCIRELYPPAIFERRRHFSVPVQWARHPDLREYIHSAVTNLQPWIQQGIVEKIAVVFLDGNQVLVEKAIFKLCLKQVTGAGLPTSHLEFALRGFLLKLCVSDSALLPLPPDCLWEVMAFMKSPCADTASIWIPADEKLESSTQSHMITTIKSLCSSCLDMQLYIEHPVEQPQNREKSKKNST